MHVRAYARVDVRTYELMYACMPYLHVDDTNTTGAALTH